MCGGGVGNLVQREILADGQACVNIQFLQVDMNRWSLNIKLNSRVTASLKKNCKTSLKGQTFPLSTPPIIMQHVGQQLEMKKLITSVDRLL